jgi:hypothetical protein
MPTSYHSGGYCQLGSYHAAAVRVRGARTGTGSRENARMLCRRRNRARSAFPPLLVLLAVTTILAVTSVREASVAWVQGIDAVMTLVAVDGGLWAVPAGEPPRKLHPDIARGATVRYLAWHPTRPELLVVRQTQPTSLANSEGCYPNCQALVRLDLVTGAEEWLRGGVGPQAGFAQPYYAPDGTWFYANIGCCLGNELNFYIGRMRMQIQASDLVFPSSVPEGVTYVSPLGIAADGRILMYVACCWSEQPSADLAGYYLVGRDGTGLERLTRGESPIVGDSLGPGNAWIVGPRFDYGSGAGSPQSALTLITLPDERERTLVPVGTMRLVGHALVATDGTIAIATGDEDGYTPRLSDVWTVTPTNGDRRSLTGGAFPNSTAFAWAPAAVVQGIAPSAAGLPSLSGSPPLPAPQASTSSGLEQVVRDYYRALDQRRHIDAYGYLSAASQRRQPYDAFQQQFASSLLGLQVYAVEISRVSGNSATLVAHTTTVSQQSGRQATECWRVEWEVVWEGGQWKRESASQAPEACLAGQ